MMRALIYIAISLLTTAGVLYYAIDMFLLNNPQMVPASSVMLPSRKAIISVQSDPVVIKTNTSYTLDLILNGTYEFNAFDLEILFDPTLIVIEDITGSNILTESRQYIKNISPSEGKAFTTFGSTIFSDKKGVLVTLKIKGKKYGTGILNITKNSILSDIQGALKVNTNKPINIKVE